MRYGFVLPTLDVTTAPKLAALAEDAGWDAVFVPDSISIETPDYPAGPTADPWITLAAMAVATQRVRLGPMIAAVTRRRPWKLAKEVATLDRLSNGRMLLPVGLGAVGDDAGFRETGERMAPRERAELLGETLTILAGLWSGSAFTHHGKHYAIGAMTQLPAPLQRPRVPIWPVALWPAARSVERALRWDGVVPQVRGRAIEPADIAAISARARQARGSEPFDIVAEGTTEPGDAGSLARVAAFAESGATWWVEAAWSAPGADAVRARIVAGPPRA
ncbi:MAG: LLM class flavin-dependent oxidoreductase [Dehalococcoidia bacterium]